MSMHPQPLCPLADKSDLARENIAHSKERRSMVAWDIAGVRMSRRKGTKGCRQLLEIMEMFTTLNVVMISWNILTYLHGTPTYCYRIQKSSLLLQKQMILQCDLCHA
jgi:hypothetical protein